MRHMSASNPATPARRPGQSGLAVDLEVAPDLPLPAPHAEALYRIVQEALANVVKHARARRAGITIARREGWVAVRVEDDGVGFPAGGCTDHRG
jgi:signal transduction histidine kinase